MGSRGTGTQPVRLGGEFPKTYKEVLDAIGTEAKRV